MLEVLQIQHPHRLDLVDWSNNPEIPKYQKIQNIRTIKQFLPLLLYKPKQVCWCFSVLSQVHSYFCEIFMMSIYQEKIQFDYYLFSDFDICFCLHYSFQ